MGSLSFEGKVAVVTGSGKGIGREIALAFASNGANVVVNARHQEDVEKVRKEVQSSGVRAVSAPYDVSTEEGVTRLFDTASKEFGRVDILVNNAGTTVIKDAIDFSLKEWETVMSTNLTSAFMCSRQAAKFMMREKWGRVINISSIAGITGFPKRSPYATSKAGMIMLTRELAIEWAKYNISVNAIAPGFFMTDLFRERIREGSQNMDAILRRVPMGRLGELKEIADLTLFLASDKAKYITGQTIAVDGGYTSYGFPE